MNALTRRRGIALLALIGSFLSTYLFLYSQGVYGSLACGAGGGCDLVQGSRWPIFLGFPVAGWGVGWYLAVLAVASIAVMNPALGSRPWVSIALLALALGGVGFTVYLKALEFFVIKAICRWCVASAALSVLIFALAVPELRALRRGSATAV